jgi:hypothetical protein
MGLNLTAKPNETWDPQSFSFQDIKNETHKWTTELGLDQPNHVDFFMWSRDDSG